MFLADSGNGFAMSSGVFSEGVTAFGAAEELR
jgi:hypothetical protein